MKEEFEFIEQVEKNYERVIPKQEYGMIVFLLFDKFSSDSFMEDELKRVVSDYHRYSEKGREQHIQIKLTIQYLSINFIRKSQNIT